MNEYGLHEEWRNTGQHLIPVEKEPSPIGKYDIYPSFKITDGQIFTGFNSLMEIIKDYKFIIIDGYAGIFYDHFRRRLDDILKDQGFSTNWVNTSDFLKSPDVISNMIAPFMGGDDPLFGTRTNLNLPDFYDIKALASLAPDYESDINLIIGPGASLCTWDGLLLYADLPKNEILFRARAGSISNLGASSPHDHKLMYKRFYFVDWVLLNNHKKDILQGINIYIDAQRPDEPAWIMADVLRDSLSVMSHNYCRVRPWFEPGAWGGDWIMNNIEGLNTSVINYAWSFELIVPENGLLFESSSRLLEVSFDTLMYLEAESVLGDCYKRFGNEFPIRFDFLDTFNGGNLSLQCHPGPDYIKKHFGENLAQEESYYILDTKESAVVFLGFEDDIDPETFRNELEESYQNNISFNAEKFVQRHNATKHDLFLIPHGTIHGAGRNNLVLEISTTHYIFTFKMYDWLRLDLDGKPRPLNIKRGMENLNFGRKGSYVKEKLIANPVLIDQGEDWKLFHLATHETHLFDVHRLHFNSALEISNDNKFLVMSLVEGTTIVIETKNGKSMQFCYAETFVIPAAADSFRVINQSHSEAILVKAFIK